ncbi:lipid-binding SYLF domain-containing protein [Salinimicrobium flavum]|uniref:YSC84-related protein n=1 Tax=Salinimicrobium flavum TaxID=1737065 RepID=A0ABW5IUY7_9FLAO
MKIKNNLNGMFTGILALMLMFSTGTILAQDDDVNDKEIVDQDERAKLQSDAEEAKQAFIAEDPRIKEHLGNAAGYAIFPNVGKGAWILGGAAGNGVVYEKGQLVGWTELRQVDIGFQIGGQAFREIIIFETQAALDRFKEGNFEFEGSASAVIWDKGKGESIQFQDGVGVALMPKAGAMVGISVGGQEFDYRDNQ